ncbi:MAG TPA: APC family permease [Polyangiaceae bacterium]|nr:APC family permease [Polyangiaceae bacterium]
MSDGDHKMSGVAAWAMAVGGMIGGGIYTLAGFILGVAGPLAWLSLALGSLIALATAHSYLALAAVTSKSNSRRDGLPVGLLVHRGHETWAGVMSWWLLFVYVLAMAVYGFTLGQYLGRALGFDPRMTAALVTSAIGLIATVNLFGIREPAGVQIGAVVIELVVLGSLAAIGFLRWNPENVVANVPGPSLAGVLIGTAGTFIAFEGFEMLVYDVRELRCPRRVLRRALPLAIVAVALAYSLVTVGAASLVGASTLVEQKENALAVAGAAAGGSAGLVVVTIAACASAVSAINASLFSVARFARSASETGLLPRVLGRPNARDCPYVAIVALGVLAAVLAASATLEPLVQTASLSFLMLFAFINGFAFVARGRRGAVSLFGAVGATLSALIVAYALARSEPQALIAFAVASLLSGLAHGTRMLRRRRFPPGTTGSSGDSHETRGPRDPEVTWS